jgi:capsular exopolysaccharide synthesis family protein
MSSMLTKLRWVLHRWTKTRVITPEEIEGVLRLPVLAIIPHLERRRSLAEAMGRSQRQLQLEGRWRSRLLVNFPMDSPAAAIYATLAEELRGANQKSGARVFGLASAVSAEGTSLTCANLAIAASRRGLKTLIIEADMRAPRISAVLNVELEPGLSGCLNRALSVSTCIQKAIFPLVDLLPSGRPAAYPGSLWNSSAFEQLLVEVRSLYDLVLVEAGPLLLYPDTAQLAQKTDSILLIHQFGRNTAERLEKAAEKLGAARGRVLGIVLNDAPSASR